MAVIIRMPIISELKIPIMSVTIIAWIKRRRVAPKKSFALLYVICIEFCGGWEIGLI